MFVRAWNISRVKGSTTTTQSFMGGVGGGPKHYVDTPTRVEVEVEVVLCQY